MNLLQRIKDGASRVTEKAQGSVEIGKLNSQISDIEREMEVEFMKMGRLFYEGYRLRDMSEAEGKMVELSRVCSRHQERIDVLRSRIAELKNERLCACGQVVALDANFCPHCGRKQEEPAFTYKAPAPPEPVYTVHEEEDEHQYYGAEDLTDEEREIALKMSPAGVYPEAGLAEDELPLEEKDESNPDVDKERRHADELERERLRQLELDRRIRDWKSGEQQDPAATSEEHGVRDMVKCQICRTDLPKGSMWCPRCGSEQI
ncbi:zinc ribbon domain-containing protein [Paenibacillus agri]|uniref:Zinc ribbon domain-containing protein n=1 Tax=Paenibacillus agri TaxID=2744309 RepID=A0A850EPS2_9BACL|nr:zinc ribbon domain-containing protein [Paenibacillus agri]NUU61740.1 zinc ribbon domain-containing protein [Paenibacillus agri]